MKTLKILISIMGLIGTIYNIGMYMAIKAHYKAGDVMWLIVNGVTPYNIDSNCTYALLWFVVAIGGLIAVIYHKEG